MLAGEFETVMLFALIALNIGVGYISKSYVVPATLGLISMTIAATGLSIDTALFYPWLQILLLLVAIFNIYSSYRKTRSN